MPLDQKLIDDCIPIAAKYFQVVPRKSHPIFAPDIVYRATKITTKLYACEGPGSDYALKQFKSFIQKNNITNIIALGMQNDFIPYGYSTKRDEFEYTRVGEIYKFTMDILSPDIQITRFAIEDGTYLIGDVEENIDELMFLYGRSLTNITVVHCHAGTGRTGHVIMTFLFFELFFYGESKKLFDTINNAQDLVKHFDAILELVRNLVPGFIHDSSQYAAAIENAFNMYKKFKLPNVDQNLIALLSESKPHLSNFKGYAFLSQAAEMKIDDKPRKETLKSEEEYITLGDTSLDAGNYPLAAEQYSCAIALCARNCSPVDISVLINCADAYFNSGKLRDSIDVYSNAIKVTPAGSEDCLDILARRAFLYDSVGDPHSAMHDYRVVINSYIKKYQSENTAEMKAGYAIKIAHFYACRANIYLHMESYLLAAECYNSAKQWDKWTIFNPNCSKISEAEMQKISAKHPDLFSMIKDAFLKQRLTICSQGGEESKAIESSINTLNSMSIDDENYVPLREECIKLIEGLEKAAAVIKSPEEMKSIPKAPSVIPFSTFSATPKTQPSLTALPIENSSSELFTHKK
ncbi:MAG: hypothetical protein ABI597_06285 [Gammaproteobacteria bacterium]